MDTDRQLLAIYTLKYPDQLTYEDYTDITTWRERAGPECDTTLLSEKSRERISAIFHKNFV